MTFRPVLRKVEGRWRLTYHYRAREFWLFGMNAEERRQVRARCVDSKDFPSFQEGLSYLRLLYESGGIETGSFSASKSNN